MGITSKTVSVTAADGGVFKAYLALPENGAAPGLVLLQEIFGVNQNMREVCDWYAARGFAAICPDLFWRMEPGLELTEKDFVRLANMNMDAVKRKDVERILKLGKSWLKDQVANQPISSKPDTSEDAFGCLIGHSKFSEARAAWERLKNQDRLWSPKSSPPIGFSDNVNPKIAVET